MNTWKNVNHCIPGVDQRGAVRTILQDLYPVDAYSSIVHWSLVLSFRHGSLVWCFLVQLKFGHGHLTVVRNSGVHLEHDALTSRV